MACTSSYTPPFQPQNPEFSNDKYGWYNCAAYVGAMGANYATCGVVHPSGATVRALTDEPIPIAGSPGLSPRQIQEALGDLGVPVTVFLKAPWTDVVNWVNSGRYVGLSVQYSVIRTTKYSGDPNFYSGHGIGIPPGWEAMDPLCDGRRAGIYKYHHEVYPQDLLRKAAGAYRIKINGVSQAIGLGWAQGWYTNVAHPSGPYDPAPRETNVKLTATVYQKWTATADHGVLRRNPLRSEAPFIKLPGGTVVTTRAEAMDTLGNSWRLLDWPAGSRSPAWLLRYGPGIPADHDFVAGPIVTDPIP